MSRTMLPHYGVATVSVERLAAAVVLFAAVALLFEDVRVEAAIRPVEGAGAATWCSSVAAVATPMLPAKTPALVERPELEKPTRELTEPSPVKPRAATRRTETRVAVADALPRSQPAELEMAITRPAAPAKPVTRSTKTRSGDGTATKAAARSAIATNNFTMALTLLTAPTKSMAHDPEHLALLAVTLVGLRRFDDAADIYAALIAMDRNDARAWVGLAVCDAQRGLPARSAEAYREAGRLASNDVGLARVVEAGLSGVG